MPIGSATRQEGSAAKPRRPLRADAARNRERILAAAEQVFAARGVSVPVDVLAEEAGVGVGTLYRHFPTKEDLLEAIILARLEDLAEETTTCRETCGDGGSRDAGEALFAFLRTLAAQALTKRDLFEALNEAGIDFKSRCADELARVELGVEELVVQAQRAGAVRADVSARDLLALISGACHAVQPSDVDQVSTERMLDIVFRGLRP